MKNITKTVFAIISTLVGAGFASGKEIYSFFFIYKINGFLGIFISSFIISLVTYQILKLCYYNDIKTYYEFCVYIIKSIKPYKDNKQVNKIANYMNNIINIFLLISFYVMISGFSSFLNQEFDLNRIIGSSIITFFCFLALKNSINSLVKLSNFLVPVFIILLLYISSKTINIQYFNQFSFLKSENIGILLPLLKSVLYASFNCVLLIPALINLKNLIINPRTIFIISFITFIIITILSLSIFNILLLGNSGILALEMPLIEIAKKYGIVLKILYIFIIGCSIYTTAISTGSAFLNGCDNSNYTNNSFMLSTSAILISQISFSTFVNYLFPVLGVIGFIEIIIILISYFKHLLNY